MMNIRNVLLVIFTIFVAESSGVGSVRHKCIHDQIAKKYPRHPIHHLGDGNDSVRDKRQANDYLPYRIAVHFVTENISNSSFVLPLLEDPFGGFQLAINYLQSVLSVIRAPHNLTITPVCAATNVDDQCTRLIQHMCGPYATIPEEHLEITMICDPTCHEVGGSGVDADYIFYVSAFDDDDCSDGTLAYASACYFDDANYRPLAGFTNICPQSLQSSTHALFMLILHETLHAIGFSSDDFGYFIDDNGERYNASTTLTINGADVLAINSPKVLNYGREYYSYPNLQGVLLENEGGGGSANSHWETRTLSYEVMIAAGAEFESDYTSISNFTLKLLEDSGWYKVDYATAEAIYNYELLWGKGLGCSFITANCDTWPYSCSPPNVDGCSYDYQAESYCETYDFYDSCYYLSPYSNGFCNSPGVPITSSCFPLTYSDNTPDGRCYDRQCYKYSGAEKPFYTVTRFGSTQLCPYDGATLTFDGTVLTCPPAELTCSRNTPIILLDSTSTIPTSLCDDSCGTCSKPVNPAYCLTCSSSLTLRGAAPSLCTADTCSEGTFLDSSGNCVACAAGCRACTGPNNSDCLACEDETLYRVTTDQPSSRACITAAECVTPVVNAFGDRTCDMIMISPTNIMISSTSIMISPTSIMISPTSIMISPTSIMISPTSIMISPTSTVINPTSIMISPTSTVISPTSTVISPTSKIIIPTNQGGGANSIHYHQFLLLFSLVIYSLYL